MKIRRVISEIPSWFGELRKIDKDKLSKWLTLLEKYHSRIKESVEPVLSEIERLEKKIKELRASIDSEMKLLSEIEGRIRELRYTLKYPYIERVEKLGEGRYHVLTDLGETIIQRKDYNRYVVEKDDTGMFKTHVSIVIIQGRPTVMGEASFQSEEYAKEIIKKVM